MSAFGPSQTATDPRVSRAELLAAVVLVCAGCLLRLGGIDRVALSHFDEGVYASNYWSGPETGYSYPASHLYAPPLLPVLIELLFSVWGPSNLAALLPGLVAGCLLIPLVWWIGREWFGSRAGLTACALASLSGPHAYFSRTALTDPLLALFLTGSVYLYWRAIRVQSRWTLVAAIGTTGLAWWTKYNGWLPLAIALSGTIPWLWFRRRSGPVAPANLTVPRETPPSADPLTSTVPKGSARPAPPPGSSQAVNLSGSAWQSLPDALAKSAVTGGVSRETPPAGGEMAPEDVLADQQTPGSPAVSRETEAAPPVLLPSTNCDVRFANIESSSTPGGGGRSVSRETQTGPPTVGVLRMLVCYSLGVLACGLLLVWQLQASGGYGAVIANHRQYVVGLAGAPQAALRQFQNLRILEAGYGRLAIAGALGLALILSLHLGRRPASASLVLFLIAAVAGAILGGFAVAGLGALVWGSGLLAPRRPAERDRLESWLALAWLTGLMVSTPCYTPYPRLTLPWLVATWLGAGGAVEQYLSQTDLRVGIESRGIRGESALRGRSGPVWLVGGGLIASAILGGIAMSSFQLLQDRHPLGLEQRGMQQAAVEITERIRGELGLPAGARLDQLALYIYGEPALFFQLRLAGVENARPVQDLKFARATEAPPVPVFLVAGDRTLRSPSYASQREAAVRLRTIDDLSAELPPLVWLDEPGEFPIVARTAGQEMPREGEGGNSPGRQNRRGESPGAPLLRPVRFEIMQLE